MENSTSLLELGNSIQSLTASVCDSLRLAGISEPTLDHGAPLIEPGHIGAVRVQRAKLLEALDELQARILGPSSYLYHMSALSPTWLATFNVLYHYQVASRVPAEGSIPYSALATQCGLHESDLRRIVRSAISLRIFEEYPDGHVRHNVVSTALAAPLAHDAVGFFAQEFTPAALALPDALQRFPGSERAGESAISIANGSTGDRDIFTAISHDKLRVERFGNAMSFNTSIPETSLEDLIENMPWADQPPKILVDIGGSRGKLCEAFLRRFPDIETAIVEDLPEVTEKNLQSNPAEDIADRIRYQAYNFFTPQVVKDADVYVFRTVLHDWPDRYAAQILRNQIHALKPGAKVIINDVCLKAHDPTNVWLSRAQCAHDLFVKMGLNAKERTREDWERLLAEVDTRLKLESIITPSHSVLSIIQVIWQGEIGDQDQEEPRSD